MYEDGQVEEFLSRNLDEPLRLESIYEVENVVLAFQELERRLIHCRELKTFRTKPIDEQIRKLSERQDRLKTIALDAMKEHSPDKKTVDFPGVAKVTRRKKRRIWLVEDEKELVSFLDGRKLKDAVIETVEKLRKTDLDLVLDQLKDEAVKVPGVSLSEEGESISIREAKPLTATSRRVSAAVKTEEKQQDNRDDNAAVDLSNVVI